MIWCGVVWCGVVWCGVVWCGVVWCGVVWCGVVWCGVVWCNLFCNVISLPTEHQGAQRTRSEMLVHFRIELEFGNVGF